MGLLLIVVYSIDHVVVLYFPLADSGPEINAEKIGKGVPRRHSTLPFHLRDLDLVIVGVGTVAE